jgi:hypothetical protein
MLNAIAGHYRTGHSFLLPYRHFSGRLANYDSVMGMGAVGALLLGPPRPF